MKITLLHWILMGLGVVAIIVEGIALNKAWKELKEKDEIIASLKA